MNSEHTPGSNDTAKSIKADEDSSGSKSERKRQAKARQNLGRKLTELKSDQLATLTITPEVIEAIVNYQRFNSREAKRRQLHFIGKLLREVDVQPIIAKLDKLEGTSNAARAELHALERLRERLLNDQQALTDYLAERPYVDRQHLRNLIKRSNSGRTDQQRTNARRELFRFLRDSA